MKGLELTGDADRFAVAEDRGRAGFLSSSQPMWAVSLAHRSKLIAARARRIVTTRWS